MKNSNLKWFGNLLSLFVTCIFLASCHDHDNNGNNPNNDILYIQTNDFNANQNAVLAYKHNPGTGELQQISGSPFYTNGSGLGNPMQILGPADSDLEIAESPDGKFLLTVNSGSNTIAVFNIHSNGALSAVAGSPFPSGGETPVSITISGHRVYVVNKSQNPLNPTSTAPNYAVFNMDNNGALTPIPGEMAVFETTPGSSPSQALVSKDGNNLFGDDFLGFMLMPPVGTLRSFQIDNGSGEISPVTGTPYMLPLGAMPPDNGALGLWQHPSGDVLYVGLPLQAKLGVFSINSNTGALALENTVPAGKAACWIRTNHSGNRTYVLNSGDNTIQVYNTSDALHPVSIQTLELKNSGPEYPGPGGAMFKTSEPFSLVLSSNERKIYIVNQHTNMDFSIGNYNFLHTVEADNNGMLSEPSDPVQIPVPNTVRPKGSLVINK